MAKPTNTSEALRKLRNADASTPQGRETIGQVLQWMEGRSTSAELRREADKAREKAIDASMREEFPGVDWEGFWRGVRRTGRYHWEGWRKLNRQVGSWLVEQIDDQVRFGGPDASLSDSAMSEIQHNIERKQLRASWAFLPESDRQEAVEQGLAESVDRPPILTGRGPERAPVRTSGRVPGSPQRGGGRGPQRDSAAGAPGDDRQALIDELVAGGMDPAVAQMVAAQMVGEEEEEPDPFIGVPEDHSTRLPLNEPRRVSRPGDMPLDRQPIYRDSYRNRPFSWPAERIAALQSRMVDAGLITGEYRHGWYDTTTQAAFAQLLGFANQRIIDWRQGLDQMTVEWRAQRDDLQREAMQAFQPDLPLPPDVNSLRQRARDTMVAMGRRDSEIDESEIAEMVKVMSGEFKRQRQVEEMRQRRIYEADVQTSFQDPNAAPITADLSDLEDVDPMARFDEWFRSSDGFGGEIETRETSAEVARRGATFEQGLNQMRGAVRRGGG